MIFVIFRTLSPAEGRIAMVYFRVPVMDVFYGCTTKSEPALSESQWEAGPGPNSSGQNRTQFAHKNCPFCPLCPSCPLWNQQVAENTEARIVQVRPWPASTNRTIA